MGIFKDLKVDLSLKEARQLADELGLGLDLAPLILSLQENDINFSAMKTPGLILDHQGNKTILSIDTSSKSINVAGIDLERPGSLTESTQWESFGIKVSEIAKNPENALNRAGIKFMETMLKDSNLLDNSIQLSESEIMATVNGCRYTVSNTGDKYIVQTADTINKKSHTPFLVNLHEASTVEEVGSSLEQSGYLSGSIVYTSLKPSEYAMFGSTYFDKPAKSNAMNEVIGRLMIDPVLDHFTVSLYEHPYKQQDDHIIVTSSLDPDVRFGISYSQDKQTFDISYINSEDEYEHKERYGSFYQVDPLFSEMDLAIYDGVHRAKEVIDRLLSHHIFNTRDLVQYTLSHYTNSEDTYLGLAILDNLMKTIGSRNDPVSLDVMKIILDHIDDSESLYDLSLDKVKAIVSSLSEYIEA